MTAAEAGTASAASPSPAGSQPTVKVLLVDDRAMVGEAVRRALVGELQMQFHFCSDPAEALNMARQVAPTVILQDLVMPGMNGLDLVRAYRAEPATSRTPIIVLTTREEPAVKHDAFAAGANDYLVKLPDRIELIARIRYHSRAYLAEIERDAAYSALRESQEKLLAANRELERLTSVDGLTGLSNRRYFNTYIEAEWKRAARAHTALSVLMIDIDHFKQYNDSYGHLAGDEALKRVANALKEGCRRSTDLAARYGGEEFAVVAPATANRDLPSFAGQLCRAVEALAIPHRASLTDEFVTVSIGGATAVPDNSTSLLSLVEAADQALYTAKRSGRNRVVIAGA